MGSVYTTLLAFLVMGAFIGLLVFLTKRGNKSTETPTQELKDGSTSQERKKPDSD